MELVHHFPNEKGKLAGASMGALLSLSICLSTVGVILSVVNGEFILLSSSVCRLPADGLLDLDLDIHHQSPQTQRKMPQTMAKADDAVGLSIP
jgi:hypothetical protein